ncbi:MAG: hypothetical protein OXJ56_11165, partial [Rhodospirillaceae bacterium]|nr:hypothetical protein [Rhodospirillaceae bacterium]
VGTHRSACHEPSFNGLHVTYSSLCRIASAKYILTYVIAALGELGNGRGKIRLLDVIPEDTSR